MTGVKWIKLSTAMFEDEKIRIIETLPEAHSILLIWVKLLILAGKKNLRGEIFINEDVPYTEEMLSTIFTVKINTVRLALQTFARFRMIEIQQDGTIVICNWSKYQNVDSLDKIRNDAAERVRRFRERKRDKKSAAYLEDVTRYVTLQERNSVTQSNVTDSYQKKKKSIEEEKDPLPSPKVGGLPEGIESDDPMGIDEAVPWFESLFHRNRAWSCEELQLLSKLVPISRDDKALIDWAYNLAPSNRFHEQTKLRQELTTLLREFNAEIDKIKTVRRRMGMNGAPKSRGIT